MSLRGDQPSSRQRGRRRPRPALPGCRRKSCTDRSTGEYTLLPQRTLRGKGGPRGDRGSEMVGTAGALRDGVPGPGPQGALLRPGLLPAGGRSALAPGLADGVPARGDPAAVRLRRVPDPRPVGRRGAHRGPGRAGVPEHLPPPWRPGGRGSGDVRDRVRLPLPRVVLRPGRQEHLRDPVQDVRRAQPAAGGPQPHAGAGGDVGWVRVDQPRRATRRRCGSASSRSPPSSTHGRWSPCEPNGGTPADSR